MRKMGKTVLRILLLVALPASCALAADTISHNNAGVGALEKGDFVTAIFYLEQAVDEDPSSEVMKRNLATAYNNFGVKLLKDGKAKSALERFNKAREILPDDAGFRDNAAKAYNQLGIKALEEKSFSVAENYLYAALRLQPEATTIRKNLSVCMTNYGVKYYEKKEYEMARLKLTDAISFDETNPSAHAFLGNTYYYTQQLEKALVSYQNALKYDPKLLYVRKKIEAIKKEIAVEGKLADTTYSIFRILYNSDDAKVDLGTIQQALWDAYYDIGTHFQYYPRHTIVVILYSPEEFKKISDVPKWVAGLYDGKIRIPHPEGMEMAELVKIIRHEYTHALTHDICKGKCVNWLNEGLARTMEYAAGEEGPSYALLKKAYAKGELLDLTTLSKNFVYMKDSKKAALAYEHSSSFVAFIIDRYGLYKVRNILGRFAKGQTTKEVLKEEFYRTEEDFLKEWKEYVGEYIVGQ